MGAYSQRIAERQRLATPPTFGDYARNVGASFFDLAGSLPSLAAYGANQAGMSKDFEDTLDWMAQGAYGVGEDIRANNTEAAQRIGAATFGSEEFWKRPFAWTGLQATNTAAPIVAGVASAIVSGPAAGALITAGMAGTHSAGLTYDQMVKDLDNQNLNGNQLYESYIASGLSPQEAKREFKRQAVNWKPAALFAVTALLARYSPAGQLVSKIRPTAAVAAGRAAADAGIARRVATAAGLGAGEESVQNTLENLAQQNVRIASGAQRDYDTGQLVEAAASGAVVGGVLAGPTGILRGHGAVPDVEEERIPQPGEADFVGPSEFVGPPASPGGATVSRSAAPPTGRRRTPSSPLPPPDGGGGVAPDIAAAIEASKRGGRAKPSTAAPVAPELAAASEAAPPTPGAPPARPAPGTTPARPPTIATAPEAVMVDMETYDRAKQLVRSSNRAGLSYLQQQLDLDYADALRLQNELAREGVITKVGNRWQVKQPPETIAEPAPAPAPAPEPLIDEPVAEATAPDVIEQAAAPEVDADIRQQLDEWAQAVAEMPVSQAEKERLLRVRFEQLTGAAAQAEEPVAQAEAQGFIEPGALEEPVTPEVPAAPEEPAGEPITEEPLVEDVTSGSVTTEPVTYTVEGSKGDYSVAGSDGSRYGPWAGKGLAIANRARLERGEPLTGAAAPAAAVTPAAPAAPAMIAEAAAPAKPPKAAPAPKAPKQAPAPKAPPQKAAEPAKAPKPAKPPKPGEPEFVGPLDRRKLTPSAARGPVTAYRNLLKKDGISGDELNNLLIVYRRYLTTDPAEYIDPAGFFNGRRDTRPRQEREEYEARQRAREQARPGGPIIWSGVSPEEEARVARLGAEEAERVRPAARKILEDEAEAVRQRMRDEGILPEEAAQDLNPAHTARRGRMNAEATDLFNRSRGKSKDYTGTDKSFQALVDSRREPDGPFARFRQRLAKIEAAARKVEESVQKTDELFNLGLLPSGGWGRVSKLRNGQFAWILRARQLNAELELNRGTLPLAEMRALLNDELALVADPDSNPSLERSRFDVPQLVRSGESLEGVASDEDISRLQDDSEDAAHPWFEANVRRPRSPTNLARINDSMRGTPSRPAPVTQVELTKKNLAAAKKTLETWTRNEVARMDRNREPVPLAVRKAVTPKQKSAQRGWIKRHAKLPDDVKAALALVAKDAEAKATAASAAAKQRRQLAGQGSAETARRTNRARKSDAEATRVLVKKSYDRAVRQAAKEGRPPPPLPAALEEPVVEAVTPVPDYGPSRPSLPNTAAAINMAVGMATEANPIQIEVQGIPIRVEAPRGSEREGVGTVAAHYGSIPNTPGVDGQNLDVYLGQHPGSDTVFLFRQHKLKTRGKDKGGQGEFDEHKAMIGFASEEEAKQAYVKSFADGRGAARLGEVETQTVDEFNEWRAKRSNTREGENLTPRSESQQKLEATYKKQLGGLWEMARATPVTKPGGVWAPRIYRTVADPVSEAAALREQADEEVKLAKELGKRNASLSSRAKAAAAEGKGEWKAIAEQEAELADQLTEADAAAIEDAVEIEAAPEDVAAGEDERLSGLAEDRPLRASKRAAERITPQGVGTRNRIESPYPKRGEKGTRHVRVMSQTTVRGFFDKYNLAAGARGQRGRASALVFLKSRLNKLVGDIPIYVISNDDMIKFLGDHYEATGTEKYYGLFVGSEEFVENQAAEDYILLNNDLFDLSHTDLVEITVHEIVHAATLTSIRTDPKLKGRIEKLINEVMRHHGIQDRTAHNGFQDADEFISEAMTDPAFQQMLASTPLSKALASELGIKLNQPTAWQAFLTAIASALKLPKDMITALHGVVSVMERIEGGHPTMASAAVYAGGRVPRVAAKLMSANDVADRARNTIHAAIAPRQPQLRAPVALALADSTNVARSSDRFYGTADNPVRGIVKTINTIADRTNDHMVEGDSMIDAISRAVKATPIAKWLEFARFLIDETNANVYADKPLSAQTHLGKDPANKPSLAAAQAKGKLADLAPRFAALSPELKALRKTIHDYMAKRQSTQVRLLIRNMLAEGLREPGSRTRATVPDALVQRVLDRKTTEADKKLIGTDLLKRIYHAKELYATRGPYIPLMRRGKWVVSALVKIPPPDASTKATRVPDTGDAVIYQFRGKDARKNAMAYADSLEEKAWVSGTTIDEATGESWVELPDGSEEPGSRKKLTLKDPNTIRAYQVEVQNKHVEFHDSNWAARRAAAELASDPAVESVKDVVPRRFTPGERGVDFLSSDMKGLIGALETKAGYREMNPAMQRELLRAANEFSLQMMGSTRIQKRRLPRRNVAGASLDIARNILDYHRSSSSYMARLEYALDVNQQLREIDASVHEGEPGTAAGRQALFNEMVKRVDAAANTPRSHGVQRLLITSFITRLASPMYTLMNLLQPGMVSMPVMAARHGVARTVTVGTKAMKDLGVGDILKKGVKETGRKAKAPGSPSETYIDELKARLKDPNEKKLMDLVQVRGTLESDKFERARTTHGGLGTEAGAKVDTVLSYMEGVARQMPTAAEVVNRSWVLLTAYRLELARNGGDVEAATRYAEDTNNMTNFNYSEANTPPLFRHPLMQIPFQFKRFGHGMYFLLGQQIGRAIRNDEPGARAEALKSLAYIVATHTLMAGALGLPTEPVKALVLGLYTLGITGFNWQDVENWERQLAADLLGPDLGEVLSRGITRALPGGLAFDISQRVGLADLMLSREPNSGDPEDVANWLQDMLIGAPGSMVVDWAKGSREVLNGDWSSGLQKLVPIKAGRDLIKTIQYSTEGGKTPSGRPSLDPYTWSEAVVRLIGATPQREAESQELKAYYYSQKSYEDEQRRSIQQRWADASTSGRLRMRGEIERYNRGKPRDAQITNAGLQAYTKRRETEIGKTEFGVVPSKTSRHIVERAGEVYNTPR